MHNQYNIVHFRELQPWEPGLALAPVEPELPLQSAAWIAYAAMHQCVPLYTIIEQNAFIVTLRTAGRPAAASAVGCGHLLRRCGAFRSCWRGGGSGFKLSSERDSSVLVHLLDGSYRSDSVSSVELHVCFRRLPPKNCARADVFLFLLQSSYQGFS